MDESTNKKRVASFFGENKNVNKVSGNKLNDTLKRLYIEINNLNRELKNKEKDISQKNDVIKNLEQELENSKRSLDFLQVNNERLKKSNQSKIHAIKRIKDSSNQAMDVNKINVQDPKPERLKFVKAEETNSRTQQDELVSIIIPSYNTRDYICNAVESALNQTYDNIEILIVDDNSQDDTLEVLKKYLDNPKIHIYKSPVNVGPYVLKNFMLDRMRGSYFTVLDSDDIDEPTKIAKQVGQFKKNTNIKCVTCLYSRQGGKTSLGWPAMMYSREVFENIGYYDSVRFAADSEFYYRFKKYYGADKYEVHINEVLQKGSYRKDGITGIFPEGSNIRKKYVEAFTTWHRSSNLKMPFNLEERPFEVPNEMLNKKILNSSELSRIVSSIDKVFVGVAAIPGRAESFKKTIDSLINQVDEIGVYLNGWDSIPEFLRHPKIKIQRSQQTGNIGDAGKFFWIDDYSGYYFTCDDDIVYPKDYIQRTINKIEQYNRNAVIGFHGSILLPNFTHYYDVKSRRVISFNFDRKNDEHVHILGTGTIGFHTSTIHVRLSDFKKPNMADIFFGRLGQKQKVPFIVQSHLKGEMYAIESKESISDSGAKRKGSRLDTSIDQNKLVKEISWEINQYENIKSKGLNILMIGRFETYTKGGIYRSNHMLKEYLTKLGHQVHAIDSMSEHYTIPSNSDICLIYPGDTSRPDFKKAEEKMIEASNMGIKCCINLSYNNEDSRSFDIERHMEKYIEMGLNVYMMVFAEAARMNPILSKYKDLMIKFPKTIKLPQLKGSIPKYNEREGIILGDVAKLENRTIINGNAQEWIDAIKKELPNTKIYAYKQYGRKTKLTGLELVPYTQDGFSDWLSKRRISVCLNQKATFEMLPVESQSFGTPVVYRDMPPSLNEWIGHTGICSNSPEEMARAISMLYNDKTLWDDYSRLGIDNAKRNRIENIGVTLEFAVRKLEIK